jgi:hypothetical protein
MKDAPRHCLRTICGPVPIGKRVGKNGYSTSKIKAACNVSDPAPSILGKRLLTGDRVLAAYGYNCALRAASFHELLRRLFDPQLNLHFD